MAPLPAEPPLDRDLTLDPEEPPEDLLRLGLTAGDFCEVFDLRPLDLVTGARRVGVSLLFDFGCTCRREELVLLSLRGLTVRVSRFCSRLPPRQIRSPWVLGATGRTARDSPPPVDGLVPGETRVGV